MPIERQILTKFCDDYHIQGHNNLGIFFCGLFYNDELIGIMSLGRHHRGNGITLDRLCFKDGVQVIGGSGKLFKQCILWAKDKGYKKIITWSDNRWSFGRVYEKIGFKLDKILSSDYSYVNIKLPYQRISKQSQKKSNTLCPSNITERDWSMQNGLARIWDCGKKRWLYNL
jgi:hypothetical protein